MTRFRLHLDGRWALWHPVPFRDVPSWVVHAADNPGSWRRAPDGEVYSAGWSDAVLAPVERSR